MTSYLRRKRVPTRNTYCCEPPNRRRRSFINWLFDSLTPGVPVVSTVGGSSLKSPSLIWRGVSAPKPSLMNILLAMVIFIGAIATIIQPVMAQEPDTPTFTNIAPAMGVTAGRHNQSAHWGDIDNDGDLDVIVAGGNSARDYLFENINNGESFVDISDAWGINIGHSDWA